MDRADAARESEGNRIERSIARAMVRRDQSDDAGARGEHVEAAGRIQIAPGVSLSGDALAFSFSSSGGPGGQNVNKRLTKAELRVPLGAIPISEAAKGRLAALAGRRLGSEGEIVIVCDENRSQERNKSGCLERLRDLIVQAIPTPKTRRATRPSRGSKMRRLETKRREGDIKKGRRRPDEA